MREGREGRREETIENETYGEGGKKGKEGRKEDEGRKKGR